MDAICEVRFITVRNGWNYFFSNNEFSTTHTHIRTQFLLIDLHIDSRDIKASQLLIIADYTFSEVSYNCREEIVFCRLYIEASYQSTAA